MSPDGVPTLLDADGLSRFLESEGGIVTHRESVAADDGRRAGLEALVIRQDDLAFEVPGLDGHFLEIMLDGRHSGFAVTDGLATGPVAEHRPGRCRSCRAGARRGSTPRARAATCSS